MLIAVVLTFDKCVQGVACTRVEPEKYETKLTEDGRAWWTEPLTLVLFIQLLNFLPFKGDQGSNFSIHMASGTSGS